MANVIVKLSMQKQDCFVKTFNEKAKNKILDTCDIQSILLLLVKKIE